MARRVMVMRELPASRSDSAFRQAATEKSRVCIFKKVEISQICSSATVGRLLHKS